MKTQTGPTSYQLAVLHAMQTRPVFAGINAHHPTKSTTKALARRRAANKAARRARRAGR